MANTNTNRILNVSNNEFDVVNVYHINRTKLERLGGGIATVTNGREIKYQVVDPENGSNPMTLMVGSYYTPQSNQTTLRIIVTTAAIYTPAGFDVAGIKNAAIDMKITLPGQSTEWFDTETKLPLGSLRDLLYNGFAMWWTSVDDEVVDLSVLSHMLQGLPKLD